MLFLAPSPTLAQVAPSLGAAQSYAVLGGTTVTNTGATTITGDLGVSPGSAVTGFPPGIVVGGTIHAADASALAAQNSVTTAYNDLASQACTQNLTGQNLGGLTLTAGVYCFNATAQLTGTLTLNGQGNPNAVFIFRIGSTLTTASGSSVVLINSASSCNVFWQVGSSATLGTSSTLIGNVLALTSITATTGANVTGRALARNGAVTLDTNSVNPTCVIGGPVCPTVVLSPATLPAGTVGTAYSQTVVGSGGTAPYVFTLVSGTLPLGLTLTPAGLSSGTPTTPGPATFTIRGTDANGCFAQITYTVVIAPAACPV
ncbi:MAG TPA: ice-binding family protein, partial [Vicinamibacteria bacterium]